MPSLGDTLTLTSWATAADDPTWVQLLEVLVPLDPALNSERQLYGPHEHHARTLVLEGAHLCTTVSSVVNGILMQ